MIREVVGEDMIEEAKLIDQYEDESKFGKDKKSYTFRIIYRNLNRTLTNEEVDTLHGKLEEETRIRFGAVVR
jgi:phenylalanyl-tRNA synthetase beta subunit